MTKKAIITTVTALAIGASSVLLLTPQKPEPSLTFIWQDLNGEGHTTGIVMNYSLDGTNWHELSEIPTYGNYGGIQFYTNRIEWLTLSNTSQCFFRAYTK